MRKNLFLTAMLCMALLCGAGMSAQASSAETAMLDVIMATHATKAYSDAPIERETLDTILAAGAKAPSARNGQPWHFTVVQSADILTQVSRSANGAMIIISGKDNDEAGMNVDFDCGLATQNMYLAAHALGLGANITLGPVSQLEEMRDALDIPDGYSVVMALTLGYPEADATSAATSRNDLESMVTYIP